MLVSELNHAASVSAAYASSRALPHAHARLASGWWLAFAGRASNPLDSDERFPSATSDLPLSQAYPGATDFQAGQSAIPRNPRNPKHLFSLSSRSRAVGLGCGRLDWVGPVLVPVRPP